MPSPAPISSGHPIQIASRRTGLSPEVLRIWEKRYGVVSPVRSATGRRLYSDQEIERLRLLRQVTLSGRRIGEVAPLSLDALRRLIADDRREASAALPGNIRLDPRPGDHLRAALDSIGELDTPGLEIALGRARLALSAGNLIEDVLTPLLREIGRSWEAGRLRPYEEHFATVVIRRLLSGMLAPQSEDVASPLLVVATPAGQRHEIGALMAAAVGSGEGWRVLYLGADLPARDIAQAARGKNARAVGLSLIHPPDDPGLVRELTELRERLPRTPILVGGIAAESYRDSLDALGVVILPNATSLAGTLNAFVPPLPSRSKR